MEIVDKWLNDLPQQFQSKKNIEVLIRAFSRQMQEIYDVFDTMELKTSIEGATGVNLDYCGQNVGLTRKQALLYLEKGELYEVTDEIYRNVLKFKILENTCDATYPNIMEGLKLLWGTEDVVYMEDSNRPATYILNIKKQPIEDPDILNNRTLTLRGMGINAVFQITYVGEVKHDIKAGHICNIVCIKSPMYTGVRKFDGSFRLNGEFKLDAAQDATATVRHLLKVFHNEEVSTNGVCDVPDRIILTSRDSTYAEAYNETDYYGEIMFADEASSEFSDDGIVITCNADISVEVDLPYREIVAANDSTHADDYDLDDNNYDGKVMFSGEASSEFVEDGLSITFQADVDFELEHQPMMLGRKE